MPLSEQLFKLQKDKNNGRGVSCVRDVCNYLIFGDRVKAKAVVTNDWDKIANYPDIAQFLKDNELAEKDAYINK